VAEQVGARRGFIHLASLGQRIGSPFAVHDQAMLVLAGWQCKVLRRSTLALSRGLRVRSDGSRPVRAYN